jgi:hypothetical protein
MPHRSDSAVQRAAETLIREKLELLVGKPLQPATVTFATGAPVQVDAVAADESVLAEIFARQGKLKPGQQKKVALDAFKLVTLGRSRPNAQLILAFADDAATAYPRGAGWLSEALKTWKVRVVVVELDEAEREKIRVAQALQKMRNPTGDEDP